MIRRRRHTQIKNIHQHHNLNTVVDSFRPHYENKPMIKQIIEKFFGKNSSNEKISGDDNLKIIDAHLHFVEHEPYFSRIAIAAGHENTESHLRMTYKQLGIVHGVVMGNRTLAIRDHNYPDFLSYCIGIDHSVFTRQQWQDQLPLIEKHFQRKSCVGVKLYPGYLPFFVYDDSFAPLYRLAEKYQKPVAVHTGLTAGNDYTVPKYCQPEVMGIAAEKFPRNQFVMCHYGEPMFKEASAVMQKYRNVSADLSGMLEGMMNKDSFSFFYIRTLKNSIQAVNDYSRFMFGTDFPLANYKNYIEFTKEFIPAEHWEKVFYSNAVRIYRLDV